MDQNFVSDQKNQINKVARWASCSIQEICEPGSRYQLDKSLYRIGENEFQNWAEKFDQVCNQNQNMEHYFKIAIFSGLILSMLFVPSIADKYGRKTQFSTSLIITLVAQFGLLITESYQWGLFFIFLMGVASPGKFIVGLMFILDFIPKANHVTIIFLFLMANAVSVVFIPFYFFQISKDYYTLQCTCVLATFSTFCYTMLFLPESPWSMYKQQKFQTARLIMEGIAKMNG